MLLLDVDVGVPCWVVAFANGTVEHGKGMEGLCKTAYCQENSVVLPKRSMDYIQRKKEKKTYSDPTFGELKLL